MEESVNLRTSFHHQGSNTESTTQAFAVTEEPKLENQHSHEDEVPVAEETVNSDILDGGSLEHGCSHYRRRCRIRAPCCDEIFNCRHCHNEAKNDINVNQEERHTIPRHEVQRVICTLCGTEQEVGEEWRLTRMRILIMFVKNGRVMPRPSFSSYYLYV